MSNQSGFIDEICSRLERLACEAETLRIRNRRLFDVNADLRKALRLTAAELDRTDPGNVMVREATAALEIATAKGQQ